MKTAILALLFTSFAWGQTGASQTSYKYPASGAGLSNVQSALQRIVSVTDFRVIADGKTDQSAKFQAAIDALRAAGGGGLFIPYSPNCYMAQDLTIYSHITFYSDSQATCVKKPSGFPASAVQVFTSRNGSAFSGGALVTDVHFLNFTIDGNQANQGGLDPAQNGLYGIFLAGSDSSIENMVLKGAYTDNITIDGAGTQTVTGTTDTQVNTCTITGAVWTSGLPTVYTCSGSHGLVIGAPVIIASVNPSGYNFTSGSPCFVITIPSASTFTCSVASNPGAYVSGGTATSYEAVNISGAGLQNLADGASVTINSVAYDVRAYVSATAVFLSTATSPGSQTGAQISVSTYNAIGSNVLIANNIITAARRNNISVDAGNWTTISGNHISYGGLANCSGAAPEAGIDREPYRYGGYFHGFRSFGNEIDHNCGNGLSIFAEDTFDPADNPITNDWIHDNAGEGVFSSNFGASTGILTIGGTQLNNATTAAAFLTGWTNAKYNGTSYGSPRGLLLGPGMVNMQIGSEAVLNGTIHDLSVDGPNANAVLTSNNTLANTGIQAGEEGSVRFPVTIIPINATDKGFVYWPASSPRTGRATVSNFCTITDTSSNPSLGCDDGTANAQTQALGALGAGFLNKRSGNVFLGANNKTSGEGSFTVLPSGASVLGLSNSSDLGTCDSGHIQQMAVVADSTTQTWGATYTGGGALHARVSCDGSNWTVFSK